MTPAADVELEKKRKEHFLQRTRRAAIWNLLSSRNALTLQDSQSCEGGKDTNFVRTKMAKGIINLVSD